MPLISSAKAYANSNVVLIAWSATLPIKHCLGFEITRIYVTAGGNGIPAQTRRVLAAWVPFKGQDNRSWQPETTSVWPVQKLFWRDLTVRQQRDQPNLRSGNVTVLYEIRPLGHAAAGLPDVPAPAQPQYTGMPVKLAYLDVGVQSNQVTVTTDFGAIQAAFNSGILSTQWLKHAFEATLGKSLTKGNLLPVINDPAKPFRAYLAGDILPVMTALFARAKAKPGSQLYLALYELTDPVLFDLILQCAPQVHLILANTGQDKTSKQWDTENQPFREKLQMANPKLAQLHHRMFNNSRIGHNKFMVLVGDNGQAEAVMTGSCNWTANGLCAQSNNAMTIDSPELAQQYLDFWHALEQDTALFVEPVPMTAGTSNFQGRQLRSINATRLSDVPLGTNGSSLTLWRSPNTQQTTKGSKTPPDLAEVFSLMRKAKAALFFAVFMPGQKGENSIIAQAVTLANLDPTLLVYGAISSGSAMPNFVPKSQTDEVDGDMDVGGPTFDTDNVHIVQASALTKGDVVGDFENELLSAGFAIIHDKILVIDPLGPDPVVVFGSHNLGFSASYANDENLVIVRGNSALAQAYMVHVLDLYDHYRYRAVLAQQRQRGEHGWEGFLQTDDSWQPSAQGDTHARLVQYLA